LSCRWSAPRYSETLHVIISKKHWRGTTHLYRINAGLAAIKANGRYTEIVNRHLGIYMQKLNDK
jgi:polar amino acid transport system substrate-binding protein